MRSDVYRSKVDTRDELLDLIIDVIARIKESTMHSDEQHDMFSQHLQIALMMREEFSKMYFTR